MKPPIALEGYDYLGKLQGWSEFEESRRWSICNGLPLTCGSSFGCILKWEVDGMPHSIDRWALNIEEAVWLALESFETWRRK